MKRTQYIISHGDISESRAIKLIDLCFDAVAKSYNEIYLALSSLGGSTHSGIALFNYLKALPITLTTHNLGTVDSASVVVFLAGQKRFACKDSRFLIHDPQLSFQPQRSFTAHQLYELANSLKNDRETMSNIIHNQTSITTDYLDKWLIQGEIIPSDQALTLGIISEIRTLEIPAESSIITVST